MLIYSTKFRNMLGAGHSWFDILKNAVIEIRSGSQPTSSDKAASGTKLGTMTTLGAALTAAVKAVADIQITGGSGSITAVLIGGSIPLITNAVAYNTSVNQTAQDLADEINNTYNRLGIVATVDTDTVTLHAPFDLGAKANGLTLAVTTTLTVSADASFASGVNGANGLVLLYPFDTDGVVEKGTDSLQMTAVATGTAGHFRIKCDPDDDDTESTSFARIDGSIATSGADLNLPSLSIEVDGVYTGNKFKITVPINNA